MFDPVKTYGQTDGRTDRRTDFKANNATVPTVLPFCEWKKTCRSLLLFKNNNVARGSQGFVRQSSRDVALRVEQPSVLNKFFFRITIFCRVRA